MLFFVNKCILLLGTATYQLNHRSIFYIFSRVHLTRFFPPRLASPPNHLKTAIIKLLICITTNECLQVKDISDEGVTTEDERVVVADDDDQTRVVVHQLKCYCAQRPHRLKSWSVCLIRTHYASISWAQQLQSLGRKKRQFKMFSQLDIQILD